MPPRGDFAQQAAWMPVAAALGVSAALPYRARLGLGGWLGRQAVTRVARLRRRIDANLRYVKPHLDEAARAALTREVGDNFGRTFIEILNNRAFHARAAWTPPEGAGVEEIDRCHRDGRGAIFVTGHFGQWEAARGWMKQRGMPCAGMYRPTENPYMNARYLKNLEYGGAPMFAKNRRGMRDMMLHLKGGGMVAILTDQYDQHAREFDFVGRPAPTSTVAAELALRFGIPMIPSYSVRSEDGEHVTVFVEDPIPHSTVEEMIQAMNDGLSARVRAHPGQYYWLHRRWTKDL